MSENNIIELTDEQYQELQKKDDFREKLVLIVFHATWCGPCKVFARILEQFTEDMADNIMIWRADIDSCSDVAQKFQVKAVPTIALIKHGKFVDNKAGSLTLDALQDWVGSHNDEN